MLQNEFGAICGEMEGGAIGHTCAANNVKFAVLRSISDGEMKIPGLITRHLKNRRRNFYDDYT